MQTSKIKTTIGHQCFTLFGVAFAVFEGIFLCFWGSDFWFGQNVLLLGIPAIFLSLTIAHFLLVWVETSSGCRFFSPIWKGRPPLAYRYWLTTDELGITFGVRHVVWEAIDTLEATFLGNILVKSYLVCGKNSHEPDIVLKFPFGLVSAIEQQTLINKIKAKHPSVKLNKRLEQQISSADLKSKYLIQLLGAIIMLLVLLDVGNSTFAFLEISKDYYLAEREARNGHLPPAQVHFAEAENILQHPFPLSWVSSKLLSNGPVAAGLYQARAQALWQMGLKNEAIASASQAQQYAPTNFRYNLYLARLFAQTNNLKEARRQASLAIDNHESALLPRLYMIALLKQTDQQTKAITFYRLYLQELEDFVFGDEPLWPPGGNRFLHELLYRDDTTFVFDRLLLQKSGQQDNNQ